MIIANGTIEIKEKQLDGCGIDPETGFPRKPSAVNWGNPVPCQYYANKYDNLGRANGEHFKIAEYTVLIAEQPHPFAAEQLRLKDSKGEVIGEFSVIQIEPLRAVCEIRILI